MSVDTSDAPTVDPGHRAVVTRVGPGVWQVALTFGYMDDPNVHEELGRISAPKLHIDLDDLTYFLGRETVLAAPEYSMHPWREQLFALQNRTAASAARFFSLPPKRVFEVGTTIEI